MVEETGGTNLPLTRPTRFSPTQSGKGMTVVLRLGFVVVLPLRLGVLRKASM